MAMNSWLVVGAVVFTLMVGHCSALRCYECWSSTSPSVTLFVTNTTTDATTTTTTTKATTNTTTGATTTKGTTNGTTEVDCLDSFDTGAATLIQCTDTEVCIKAKYTDARGVTVQRGCREDAGYIHEADCKVEVALGGITSTDCYCTSDECNGSHVTLASALMVAASCVAARLSLN